VEQPLLQTRLRADAYKILAGCYYSPGEELLQAIGDLAAAGQTGLDQLAQAAASDDIETLLVDHTRLFIGPYKLLAPPYGSVYLEEGVLMGNSTMNVEEFYRQESMETSDQEVPDHITAELEFMYVLASREIEAMEVDDLDTANRYRQKQKDFLSLHLGAWITEFTDRIQQEAQTEFYNILGRITAQFVREDIELLSDRICGV
jgi:putative dimethyl sulfoxide reductase chaperone